MLWAFWGSDKKRWEDNCFLNKKNNLFPESTFVIDRIIGYAKKKKIQLISLDQLNNLNKVDCIFFFDYPKIDNFFNKEVLQNKRIQKILFIHESKVIHPENFQYDNYKYFSKIFTWCDDIIDNKKIFKFYDGYDHNNFLVKKIKKKYFSCMINENKIFNYDISLYHKRIECIKWFEKNHCSNFHLYGFNWNKRFIPSKYKIIRIFNRIDFLTKKFSYNFRSYKGIIKPSLKSKLKILKKYKFSFVFENASENGWITEKLFHCFFSLTVPIYIGAKNINKYIPKNCFINFNNFNNYEELYMYLSRINNNKYFTYIKNIKIFLSSQKYKKFTSIYNFDLLLKKLK
jgi:hypothetical protein